MDDNDEIKNLRRLLRWVWENHADNWCLVCDEELEIEKIARVELDKVGAKKRSKNGIHG